MENQLSILLSKNKLLKNVDISKFDLNRIKGKLLTVSEGQILYREGDSADNIFLVINGEINIIKKRLLGKTKSLIYTDNDFFGNDEFFEETSRVSTAIALRDSYVLMISREEVDYLISQNDEVFVNLHQPVSEIEEPLTENKEINDFTMEDKRKQTFEEIPQTEVGIIEEGHFNSIADVSRIEEENIIPKLDEAGIVGEEKIEFEKQITEDITSKVSEKIVETPVSNSLDKIETKKEEDFIFDENIFLNEDGIPLSSFGVTEEEIPGEQAEKGSELDDVLFEFLTSTESSEKSEEVVRKEDSLINEIDFDLHNLQKEKLEVTSIEEENLLNNYGESLVNDIEVSKEELLKEEVIDKKNSLLDFETEELFEEIEKEVEKIKEQVIFESKNNIEQPVPIFDKEEKMKSDQLQMIIKAAELVNSTIKIDEVLKNIVEVATGLTNADRGTLYLIDKEKR